MRVWPASRTWRIGITLVLAAGAVAAGSIAFAHRGGPPSLTTTAVMRDEYVDVVEIRGIVKPYKSVVLTAPMQSGELQILSIAKNGSAVKAGDVVVEFDGSTLQRTVQEKQSELKQAQAEYDQEKARANIARGEDTTALVKSSYDVERAKLDVNGAIDIVSRVDASKARLALADAEALETSAQVTSDSNGKATTKGFSAFESRIAKIHGDLDRAAMGLQQLKMTAPSNGVVNIMQNWRSSTGGGNAPEFRAGDSCWPGAEIVELPDLSSVHIEARLDESDRGRLRLGQSATVKIDAIADHEFQAAVSDLSVLARVDFSSWPPVKNFDLKLQFRDADARLRPGMSAAARIAVGRLANMLIVPAESVFFVDGRSVVYRLEGRQFAAVPVQIVKRSRDQAAVNGPLQPGDRVALTKPPDDMRGGGR